MSAHHPLSLCARPWAVAAPALSPVAPVRDNRWTWTLQELSTKLAVHCFNPSGGTCCVMLQVLKQRRRVNDESALAGLSPDR